MFVVNTTLLQEALLTYFWRRYCNHQQENNTYLPKYDYAQRYSNNFLIVDEARETRGSYQNVRNNIKTKTSNAAITDASYQVTLATHAIASEDFEKSSKREENPPFQSNYYLPIIVTTANLFVCDFDPQITSIINGEVPLDQLSLNPVKKLFYEYPVPPHLQIKPDEWWLLDRAKQTDKYVRRCILVVNSNHFEETLNWLVYLQDVIVA